MLLKCSWRSLLGPSCNDCRCLPFWGQAVNSQSQLRLLWHPAICCFHLFCSHSATLKDSNSVSKVSALGFFSSHCHRFNFLSCCLKTGLWFIGQKAGWWCRNDDSQPGLHGHKESNSSVKCHSYHMLCVFKCKCVWTIGSFTERAWKLQIERQLLFRHCVSSWSVNSDNDDCSVWAKPQPKQDWNSLTDLQVLIIFSW